MKLSYLIIISGVLSILAVLAHASTSRDESYFQRQTQPRSEVALIEIHGILMYAKDGTLKLREKNTGRTFALTEEDSEESALMQMYDAGQRDISVQGVLQGEHTIAVRSARD